MALIACRECGGNVSTQASACPHCGCPLGTAAPLVEQPNPTQQNASNEPWPGVLVNDDGSLWLSSPTHFQEVIQAYGSSLTSLEMAFTDFRDSHFGLLPRFSHLESLKLIHCEHITDAALVSIAKCPEFAQLDLFSLGQNTANAISPVGLRHLARLSGLELLKFPAEFLTLKKSSPVGQAIEQLRLQLPMCVIENAPLFS